MSIDDWWLSIDDRRYSINFITKIQAGFLLLAEQDWWAHKMPFSPLRYQEVSSLCLPWIPCLSQPRIPCALSQGPFVRFVQRAKYLCLIYLSRSVFQRLYLHKRAISRAKVHRQEATKVSTGVSIARRLFLSLQQLPFFYLCFKVVKNHQTVTCLKKATSFRSGCCLHIFQDAEMLKKQTVMH